ncbi:MAG: hypothetical protein Q9192_005188 [Flavoplaca navasiana]
MCEMMPKRDPAELQNRSEGRDEPARHNEPAGVMSSDHGDVVRALEDIKKLKTEMDAKVAAVEAAIRTRNQSTALTLSNGPGQDTGRISENLPKTAHNFAPVPAFGEIGQLERTRTCGEASVDFRSDTPIFGSFRSTSQSTLKPNSEAEGRPRASKDNARVAEPTKQPQIGAVTTSGAGQVAAGTSSEASNLRAIVNPTTSTNDHMDPTKPGLAAASISGISSTMDPVALQPPVPEDSVQTSNAVVKQSAQPSARPIGDQPMSGCDVNESRSSIDLTAVASVVSEEASHTTQKPVHVSNSLTSGNKSSSCSSGQADGEADSCSDESSNTDGSVTASADNEEASESTERARNEMKSGSNSEQTAVQSNIRALESASANGPEESNNGTDDEDNADESGGEESDDDGTSEGDSDDSSSGDEDTQMEDTETSEQSEDSDVPDPKPIEVWRTTIVKPESTGTPKSVRAVSPSHTIPAAPIRKRNNFMSVWIAIPDRDLASELQRLTRPELKYRLEREMLCKSRIQSCKVTLPGKVCLHTTERPGSRLLQNPSNWRPGAFGKGATVLAHKPRRTLPLR